MTGLQFTNWTVLGDFRQNKGVTEWLCRCTCGTERFVNAKNLLRGTSKGCGCTRARTGRAADLTNRRFGMLTALRRVENRGNLVCWECVCDCGNHKIVTAHNLYGGHTKSCGCLQKSRGMSLPNNTRDLRGYSFGFLQVLEPTDQRDKKGYVYWRCRCTRCGNEVLMPEGTLLRGETVSCGCYRRDHASETMMSGLHFVDNTCLEWLEHRKKRSDNKSGFQGVRRLASGRYETMIGFRKDRYYLGVYDTFDEAVDARCRGEQVLYEAFAAAYREWKQHADLDPQWAEANPFTFLVHAEDLGPQCRIRHTA